MTGEGLLRHIKAQPFVPFRMHLADGRSLRVEHPEFVLYLPGYRTCVVGDPETGLFDMIDLLLVTSIQTEATQWNGNGTAPEGQTR